MFQRIHPTERSNMTPSPTQIPALPLDPASLALLHTRLRDAMPHRPNATEADKAAQHQAALVLVAALRPRDPIEAMLVTRIVLADFHAVACLASAGRSDVPEALGLRHLSRAATLIRLQEAARRELARSRATAAAQAWRAVNAAGAPRAQPAQATAQDAPAPRAMSAPPPAPAAAAPAAGSAAPVVGRHERRRRERLERRLAAAAQSGLALAA
jgi:hypothetical protein